MGVGNWIMVWTAIMPLAVLIYYFFRKKYKVKQIPSTLFWDEWMKEWRASPYLKKLQQNLLFYLQMAALLLFVFLLLEPYTEQQTLAGEEWIFVVDASSSMLAGTPSRFDVQKGRMKEFAEDAGGRPVTLIVSGAAPQVELRQERDSARVLEAIDDLQVQYANAEMAQTLAYADTFADGDRAVIHIFTDSLDRSVLANRVSGVYEVHGFAEQPANVSIRQFGVAEREDGMAAIVQVVNETGRALPVAVEITDGEVTEEKRIDMEDGEEQLVTFDSLPATPLWNAEITADDDYGADNRMAAYLQQSADRIAVDASLHELLATGFSSFGAAVQLVPPEQLQPDAGAVVATNRTGLLDQSAPILLIGRDDADPAAAEGAVTVEEHPLFTYADVQSVYVAEVYPAFEGYETIARVGEDPWIQVSPNGHIVILSDIQSTDWPLSPSFPLFLWSAVNEAAGSQEFLGTFRPNEMRSLSLVSPSGEWDLYKGSEFVRSYREDEGAFTAPADPGVYDLVGDQETLKLIVQLSQEEKVLQAGGSYKIGQAGEAAQETARSSFLPWLVPIVLLLILIEWEVYRRGTARR